MVSFGHGVQRRRSMRGFHTSFRRSTQTLLQSTETAVAAGTWPVYGRYGHGPDVRGRGHGRRWLSAGLEKALCHTSLITLKSKGFVSVSVFVFVQYTRTTKKVFDGAPAPCSDQITGARYRVSFSAACFWPCLKPRLIMDGAHFLIGW